MDIKSFLLSPCFTLLIDTSIVCPRLYPVNGIMLIYPVSNSEISTPVTDVKITSISIDTFGVNYDKPETIQPFNYMKWLYSQYGLNYTE